MKKYLISILILILIVLTGFFSLWNKQGVKGEVLIQTDKTEYESGGNLKLKMKNNFDQRIGFSSCYPYYLERKNDNWVSYQYQDCSSPNVIGFAIEKREEKVFEIKLPVVPSGVHRLSIPICINCAPEEYFREDKRFYSNEFNIK